MCPNSDYFRITFASDMDCLPPEMSAAGPTGANRHAGRGGQVASSGGGDAIAGEALSIVIAAHNTYGNCRLSIGVIEQKIYFDPVTWKTFQNFLLSSD
jgi:hypothetical protein